MRKRLLMLAAAGAMGAIAGSAAAQAVTFPATEFGRTASGQFESGAGTSSTATDTASAGFTPGGPFVSISGSHDAGATAGWNFEVTTGDRFDVQVVHVVISGSYDVSSTGGGFGVGEVLAGEHNSNLSQVYLGQCLGGTPGLGDGGCAVRSFSVDFAVLTNDFNDIEIIANGGLLGAAPGTFRASIDPLITLAPGFQGGAFTLQVSPDAQPPAGGVPEPATWALMILGFGATGAALRRRRAAALA